MPPVCSVKSCRFIKILSNVGKTWQENQHLIATALPSTKHYNARHCCFGVTQPVVRRHTEQTQHWIQKSVGPRCQNLFPQKCRNWKWNYNGSKKANLKYFTSKARTVYKKSKQERKSYLQRNNTYYKGKGVFYCTVKRSFVGNFFKKFSKVFKTYKFNIIRFKQPIIGNNINKKARITAGKSIRYAVAEDFTR